MKVIKSAGLISMLLAILIYGVIVAASPNVISVPAGSDLNAVLASANCGDILELQAGAEFAGTIALNKVCGSEKLVLRSSRLSELPEGKRVNPSQAFLMPKITSPGFGNPAIQTTLYAAGYRFEGIEVRPKDPETFAYSLIWLGSVERDQDTLEKVAKDIVFDRSYIHAWPNQSLKRGIDLHSGYTEITNSYLEGFKAVGQEAQAILGCRGPGPYKIINNHLEGAGENVMFGGCDPIIQGVVPSDIEIRQNYFYKPLAWRGVWQVKNLFELKNAERVLIEGNVFENNWADAQNGHAIVFTPRNQEGSAPWSRVRDVQFINNIVRHATEAFQISATDNLFPTTFHTKNITIANNLFDDINNTWSNSGLSHAMWSLSGEIENLTIDHNTALTQYNLYMTLPTQVNFTYTNNISAGYPICDGGPQGGVYGIAGLNLCAAGSIDAGKITGNVVEGIGGGYYPSGNFTVSGYAAIGFVDLGGKNYRLASTSPFKGKGTNGSDPGANIDAIEAAIGGAVTPLPSPTPTPVPSPTPSPVPSPTPTPVPSPTPSAPCILAGPGSVIIPQNSFKDIALNMSGNTNATVTVTVSGSTGQVTVAPISKTVSGTSAILAYRITVKKQSRTVTFNSTACGSVSTSVTVN